MKQLPQRPWKISGLEAIDNLRKALLEADKYDKVKQLLKQTQLEPSGAVGTELSQNLWLLASKDWANVRLVLQRMANENPKEPLLSILLVKANLGCAKKGSYEEAVRWGRWAVQACEADGTPDWLNAQAHKALGAALSTTAAQGTLPQQDRVKHRREAMSILSRLADKSGEDALVLYNMALLHAESRQYTEALKNGRAALSVSEGLLAPAWALVALILSGRRELSAALEVLDGALSEVNEVYESMFVSIKSKLLIAAGAPHEGIAELAKLCGKLRQMRKTNSWHSDLQKEALMLQEAQLWGELALSYVNEGQQQDAEYCLDEMTSLAQWTPDSLYAEARIRQAAGDITTAIRKYETALAMNPDHALSCLHLGMLYWEQTEASVKTGTDASYELVTAHSMLSDAVRHRPDNHRGWYYLAWSAERKANRKMLRNSSRMQCRWLRRLLWRASASCQEYFEDGEHTGCGWLCGLHWPTAA
ncbi:unnamed protein product [Ostreobium quekettii]|uniref:Uncharacterized protein n=1 Tax=Ostreobium quekettii TaxID=121088 RepID=A0A8S1INR6_9CHLO|nr:unnamed protein product [Ostreobium quekettii]|eukprot:evm.model.scf_785.6 EVM.evm.TU.scf_785.6   scf_785:50218-54679(+)